MSTGEYVKLIADNPAERFLIALPTNQLKEEVRERLVNKGVPERDIFMTASVHGNAFIPLEIQAQISGMHNRGIHNMTKEIISDYYEKIRADPLERKAVEEECEKILAGIKGVKDERVIVTTHAYLAQLEKDFLKNYTVIIDEDFLQLFVFNRMYKVSVKCLEELAKKDLRDYSDAAAMVLGAKKKSYTRMKPVRYGIALTKEELGELENFQADDNIAKEMAGKPKLDIITFKKFETDELKTFNIAGIHFGNSTGLNGLEGHDLAVIGTPYRVEEYYKLIACYLGAEVNQEGDKRPSQRRVEYKGNSFLITTYKDKVLREEN